MSDLQKLNELLTKNKIAFTYECEQTGAGFTCNLTLSNGMKIQLGDRYFQTKQIARQELAKLVLELNKEKQLFPTNEKPQLRMDNITNFKGELQEYCQKKNEITPVYQSNSIPGSLSHMPKFVCTVTVLGKTFNTGNTYRNNKKDAEQLAAKIAIEALLREEAGTPAVYNNEPQGSMEPVLNQELDTDDVNNSTPFKEDQELVANVMQLDTNNTEKKRDYMSKLNEFVRKRWYTAPKTSFTTDDNGSFVCTITVQGDVYKSGQHSNKNDAIYHAAKMALECLLEEDEEESEEKEFFPKE